MVFADSIIILVWVVFLIVALSIGGVYSADGSLAGISYPLYQDVHVMIFVGFGLLYSFLKHQSFGSVTQNFLFGALSIPTTMFFISLFRFLFHENQSAFAQDQTFSFDVPKLIDGDFGAAAVLITLGGVLGRISMAQGLVMTFLELIFYSLNVVIFEHLGGVDAGGSIIVHAFGAFFGLGFSFMFLRGTTRDPNERNYPSKTSNVIAMIGTLFLFCYWPSFNGGTTLGDDETRVTIYVNTVLSLSACVAVTCAVARMVHGHFNAEAVLNATLAGGVAMGGGCDLFEQAFWPMLIGSLAAVVSVFGFSHLSPKLKSSIGLHDTCGILNLHGVPGVIGGIFAAIGVALPNNEAAFAGKNQSGIEFLGLVITLGIAIVSGMLVGAICRFLPPVDVEFSDKHWIRPTVGDTKAKKHKIATRSAPVMSLDHTDVEMQEIEDEVSQDEYELDHGDEFVAKALKAAAGGNIGGGGDDADGDDDDDDEVVESSEEKPKKKKKSSNKTK